MNGTYIDWFVHEEAQLKSMKFGLWMLAILAIGVAIAGCGSDETHGTEGSLTLSEPAESGGKHFGLIGKVTSRTLKAGNGFAFSAPLQESGGKTVGEINAFCIATQPSPGEAINGTCSGTAAVPGGGFALNVGGKEIGGTVSGAIIGGTGKYSGALGTFTSKEESTGKGEGPSTLTFHYTLP
jgi:hypothetical protein